MFIFNKYILIGAFISLCLADEPRQGDWKMTSRRESGHQSGIVSLQQKLPTHLFKGFAPDSFQKMRCPLCDTSVYSYCGEKLLHDACCCTDPYIHPLPYQCRLADCSFLHANSCRQHKLIANCCCTDEYRNLLKILT